MPTLWTQTLIPTLREAPADAEVPSHKLMLRAGFIRKLAAGSYDYLPLGWRSLRKAIQIIREEMAAAGAEEVFLPALQPLELWEQTGRREAYGENLFVVQDRHGRKMALGPTHEEVITELVGATVQSHKDLPKTLYQIQTKFRDEFRPRFGVLRSREFQMKDAYSFHLSLDGPGGLDETYQKQFDAYCRIFERCGIPYEVVEAESGPIGGSASHEFMVPSPTGEDTILKSDASGGTYAANVEKCEIGTRACAAEFAPFLGHGHSSARASDTPSAPPTGELEKVHTPGCASIEDVAAFFKKNLGTKLKTSNMLKTLVYLATTADYAEVGTSRKDLVPNEATLNWARPIVVVLRGDHEVNENKLLKVIKESDVRFAHVELISEAFAKSRLIPLGFVSPTIVLERQMGDAWLIIDPDAAQGGFWVTGANDVDHHVKHFHWQRDVLGTVDASRVKVADIRNAVDGDPSPKNDGGVLRTTKGIEIGHVFKLGDKYTKAMGVSVLGADNQRVTPIMGCYGIGVNRILAGAIEREGGNDENGIIWPKAIAPFAVLITALKYEGQSKEVVDGLARELEARGNEVLIDNRDERPGVKFKDADLIGIPLRITVGEKGLAEGNVEMKLRNGQNGPKGENVALAQAVERAVALLQLA